MTLYAIKDNNTVVEEYEVELNEDEIDINYLLELIQELPDRYRLVFNLYVLDNFSHKEIAGLLRISEGTSKSNLSRARMILKQKVDMYKKKQEEA